MALLMFMAPPHRNHLRLPDGTPDAAPDSSQLPFTSARHERPLRNKVIAESPNGQRHNRRYQK